LADIVQPSPSAKNARAISSMDLASHSGSRCWQNQAFSAKRQASKYSGIPPERHRLSAPRVVGDREHHQGDALAADLGEQAVELRHVHVALERVLRRDVVGRVDHAVHGDAEVVLDVGARGVEVDVVGHAVARLHDGGEQQVLRHPALVRGDHVPVAGDALDHPLEVEVVAAARVRLVAEHDARPLPVAHRRGAGVGQQVDGNERRGDVEEVVAGGGQGVGALLAGGEGDGLDDLDLERFHGQVAAGPDGPDAAALNTRSSHASTSR
jgi:hypothetical protein